MILITITGKLTGRKALLYEFPGRKGKRKYVPTYVAFAQLNESRFEFSVTRDSSFLVFGGKLQDIHDEKGECPPSADVPYSGTIRKDGPVGFRVELHDRDSTTRAIVGQSGVWREYIQIHFGAAAAYGCIMVAGRHRAYRQVFEKPLQAMLKLTEKIQVAVEPRWPSPPQNS